MEKATPFHVGCGQPDLGRLGDPRGPGQKEVAANDQADGNRARDFFALVDVLVLHVLKTLETLEDVIPVNVRQCLHRRRHLPVLSGIRRSPAECARMKEAAGDPPFRYILLDYLRKLLLAMGCPQWSFENRPSSLS